MPLVPPCSRFPSFTCNTDTHDDHRRFLAGLDRASLVHERPKYRRFAHWGRHSCAHARGPGRQTRRAHAGNRGPRGRARRRRHRLRTALPGLRRPTRHVRACGHKGQTDGPRPHYHDVGGLSGPGAPWRFSRRRRSERVVQGDRHRHDRGAHRPACHVAIRPNGAGHPRIGARLRRAVAARGPHAGRRAGPGGSCGGHRSRTPHRRLDVAAGRRSHARPRAGPLHAGRAHAHAVLDVDPHMVPSRPRRQRVGGPRGVQRGHMIPTPQSPTATESRHRRSSGI